MRREIENAQTLVVKIGSSLAARKHDALNHKWLAAMADDLARLSRQPAKSLIVVTSGAVSLGCAALGFARAGLSRDQMSLGTKPSRCGCRTN